MIIIGIIIHTHLTCLTPKFKKDNKKFLQVQLGIVTAVLCRTLLTHLMLLILTLSNTSLSVLEAFPMELAT